MSRQVFSKSNPCPKCGETKASAVWCRGVGLAVEGAVCELEKKIIQLKRKLSGGPMLWSRNYQHLIGEHMERKCGYCGYAWLEKPLDQGAPLEQLAAQSS